MTASNDTITPKDIQIAVHSLAAAMVEAAPKVQSVLTDVFLAMRPGIVALDRLSRPQAVESCSECEQLRQEVRELRKQVWQQRPM